MSSEPRPNAASSDSEDVSLLLHNPSQYWLNYDLKTDRETMDPFQPTTLLPPFSQIKNDNNTPTGSIACPGSFWTQSSDHHQVNFQRRSGRVILSCLAALRVATPLPAILSFMKMSEVTVSRRVYAWYRTQKLTPE